MINSIRNTVLFLLNKDNRGYVSPSEFDYFAKLAQLEIFESYFSNFAKVINLTFGGGFDASTTMAGGKIIQQVSSHKFDMIVNSNLSTPSVTYPIFTRQSNKAYVRPLSIAANNTVFANYIKKPADPHWGYININSDPVYNPDSSVDFEISEEDETDLIIKICKYAGLSIREADVVQMTTAAEKDEFTKENL